ncbi:hypothetical protein GY45DRAFT_645403 [Cubamyces sp. BRFM 1775]|nr:hypothetical protein GY45DRAFT_645403 [Cubamyces sp. BRFM 1775]
MNSAAREASSPPSPEGCSRLIGVVSGPCRPSSSRLGTIASLGGDGRGSERQSPAPTFVTRRTGAMWKTNPAHLLIRRPDPLYLSFSPGADDVPRSTDVFAGVGPVSARPSLWSAPCHTVQRAQVPPAAGRPRPTSSYEECDAIIAHSHRTRASLSSGGPFSSSAARALAMARPAVREAANVRAGPAFGLSCWEAGPLPSAAVGRARLRGLQRFHVSSQTHPQG